METFLDRWLRRLRIRRIRPYVNKGVILCDIGCGPNAQLLRDLSGYVKEGIGFDKKLKAETFGNITLKNIRLTDILPLPAKSADVVTMLAVLEHLEQPVEILREVRRILKPDGVLLITVPTVPNRWVGEFLAYRLKLIDEREYRDHKRYYSKAFLKEQLKLAGFDISRANFRYFELGMNLFAKVPV